MKPLIDHTGQRFGKLTVMGRGEGPKGKSAHWDCRCDCGGARIARGDNLRRGRTWHCGCEMAEHLRRNMAKGRIVQARRARGRQRMSVPDMAELLAKRLLARQGVLLTPEARTLVREAYR